MIRSTMVLLCFAAACGGAQQAVRPAGAPAPTSAVRTVMLRPALLERARTRVRAGDKALKPAYERLRADADKALAAPLVAVTDKKSQLAPSNDPHDYYSLSPYWWPDPSKADGLPYIRRDGETNPESKRDLDQPRVARMGANVQTLALAWFFTGEEKYAARAAAQLRAWFLDPATRMNPHLRYSQLIKGDWKERRSGVIDTRWFIEAVDAAALLEQSRSWRPEDARAMRAWVGEYLRWLTTGATSRTERDARNNHGSWYAAQATALALYAGDTATARALLAEAPARIGWQITAAGEQPIENERTRSMHYAGFNVEALSRLAEMGRALGVDLWTYQAPEGGSLRRAVDHLAKYVADPSQWPGTQIDEVEPELFLMHLRRTHATIPDANYSAVMSKLPAKLVQSDRSALLYPDP